MTYAKPIFLCLALLSLSACQTTSGATVANDVLLSNISATDISTTGATRLLNSSSPTCLTFYENTAKFAALPAADLSAPTGPSFGSKLLKTVVLGTLSGVVSGGVSAIGIESQFAEAALIGTAGQVTYQAGGTVYDKIVKTDVPNPAVPAVPALTPMQEIQKAANLIGCPAPDEAAIAALKIGATQ